MLLGKDLKDGGLHIYQDILAFWRD